MALTSDLLVKFAKTMSESESTPVKGISTQVEGTAKLYSNKFYVQLDGSDQLTPVISSTAGMKDGDRVTVLIKDHSAKVVGNISSPSAGSDDLDDIKTEVGNKISEFEIVIADKVSTKEFEAEKGRIDNLVSDNVTIKDTLVATNAAIGELEADNVTINEKLTAAEADIDNLEATKLSAEIADIKYATIENLNATNADINNLEATYAQFEQTTTDRLEAAEATIGDLDVTYANIDFTNIGIAAVEELFAKSGIIEDLVVSSGHITGELVGVTIKGDLIEGNTIKADKLVVLGSDGLYYKLNVNAETVSGEQTEYNSLSGSIITANTITAEKINVDDLVAFDATIGGFIIDEDSIHTTTKTSVNSMARGLYMDNDGQVAFGDDENYLKYYKDTDNTYKLAISANAIKFTTSEGDKSLDETISDLEDKVDLAGKGIDSIVEFYAVSSSNNVEPEAWSSTTVPVMTEIDKYLWNYERVNYTDGTHEDTKKRIIGVYGNKGDAGDAGLGLASINNFYLVSSQSEGITTETAGWSEDVYTTTPENRYLWNYELVTYTDNTTATFGPRVIGVHGESGDPGTPGRGIQTVANWYLATSAGSGITVDTEGWTQTVQALTATNKYLWNYEEINFTDSTTSRTTPCVIGTYGPQGLPGNDGDPGTGITSIEDFYQVSNSGTEPPSTWVENPPTLTASNRYLWTYEKITYTDGNSTETAKRVIGTYGVGISGTEVTYQVSNSGTNIPSGVWGASVPTVSEGQFLWTRTVIARDDGTSDTAYSVSRNGQNGSDGSDGRGVQSSTVTYQRGESATVQPTDEWTEEIPTLTPAYPYLWTRTDTLWSDNTHTYAYSVSVSPDGLDDINSSLGQLDAIVTEHTDRINTFEQNQEGFEFSFNTLTNTVTQIGDRVSNTYTEQLKYIKFIDGEIWLGRDPDEGQDDFKVVISNERIRFLQNNVEVAYLSNNQLYITNGQILKRLDLGKFAFFPRDNGNLTFRLA